MSIVNNNPNIQSGDIVDAAYDKLSQKLATYDDFSEKAELSAKIIEAEYLHDQRMEGEDIDVAEDNMFFSQAGTENFEEILQGAKQSIDEEQYQEGKAYLLKHGSDVINEDARNFLDMAGVTVNALYDDTEPVDWFNGEFNDEYSPEDHVGFNPDYLL